MSESPSSDNHKNRLQDSMSKALDSVMAKEEQSYDNFIASFTFLKKQDVLPQMNSATQLSDKTKSTKNVEPHTSDSSFGRQKQPHSRQETKPQPQASEELETEILADGETSSRLSKAKVIRTGTSVKVDNFVEGDMEEDDCDGDVYTGGYTASFSDSKPSQTNQVPNQPPCDSSAMDRMAELFDNKVCLDENSTDKLLMNFLADLQNEENEHNMPVSGTQQNSESGDIQNFLEKKKEEKEEVVFSDDDSEADNLVDNSDKGRVKVLVKPNELENIKKTKPAMEIIISDEIQMDSEGVRVSGRQSHNDDSHDASESPVAAMLFPGEAEKREENVGTTHESLLDFKANYREPGMEDEQGTSVNNQVECDNSVEPFVLDENFDYDNVMLTPKYSQGDIHRLQTLITQMSSM